MHIERAPRWQKVLLVLCLGLAVWMPAAARAVVVNIPDPALEAGIRAVLNQPTGDLEDTALATIGSLSIDGANSGFGVVQDLTGLEYCININYLDLVRNNFSDVGDLAPLAALDSVVTLYLSDSDVTSLAGVGGMASLITLIAPDNLITDLSPLSTATTLRTLFVSRNFIEDLSPLNTLTSLEELDLNGNALSSLTGLAGCTALKQLVLDNTFVADLTPLANLPALEVLTAYDSLIADLTPLAGVESLRDLRVEAAQVASLTPLSGLTALEHLSLYTNFFTDITPLAGLTALTFLDISSCPVADFSPLGSLTALVSFSATYGPFADTSVLDGLDNLTNLRLSGTPITTLAPLLELPALASLEICDLSAAGVDVPTQVTTLRGAGVTVTYGSPDCTTGEGEGEGAVEGEGVSDLPHTADQNGDLRINLSELLRVIQFYNVGGLYCDVAGEDGFAPGIVGDQSCAPHASDYTPQNWVISLSELLRVIQIYNVGAYYPCVGTEDDFCLGSP